MASGSPLPVAKLDSNISTLFRRGQLITKVSDVVRELIDNAIDADSTRVQILLDNYGLDKIEVRDDGHGIEASQLGYAVSGGYTSKLNDSNHLSCGTEYGFRGEALSSICSFATVSIITKTEVEQHALKYNLDHSGRVTGQTRTGNGRGTVVTVRDLFVKFPVRRNFVREKSRAVSELKEIENYLKSIGLANPPIYLSLVHDGNMIWSKPILKSMDQALGSVFGIQVAKYLSKCGPVDVSSNTQHSVTRIECYIPKVPIDPKLMTTSSTKMCVVLVNRRRVHIGAFEKLLHQYILGAIQMGTTQVNLKGKHPVAVLKIDTPSTLVDFNRELDKSKVFLQHTGEILEELENILRSFYPVDFNQIKENLDTPTASLNVQPDVTGLATTNDGKVQVPSPADNVSLPAQATSEHSRTKNISDFLNEIPTASKENFSQSPGKTGGFEKRRISGNGNEAAAVASSMEDNSNVQQKTSSAVSSLSDDLADRNWALGRMKDAKGNVIENVCVVRSAAFNHASGMSSPATTSNSFGPSEVLNQPPSTTSEAEFFARLQTCHLKVPGSETPSTFHPPPPAKRLRSNSFSPAPRMGFPGGINNTPVKPVQNSSRASLSDRKQTPQGQTRYLKLTGNGTLSSSFEPPTPAKRPTSVSFATPSRADSNSGMSEALQRVLSEVQPPPGVITQVVSSAVDDFFARIEARDLREAAKPSATQPPPKLPPSATSSSHLLRPTPTPIPTVTTLHSSVIFKKRKEPEPEKADSTAMELSPTSTPSQSSSESVACRVIGRLPGKPLHVVKIDSLLGVFSASNLLKMAPWFQEKICTPNGQEPDEEAVKTLLAEFPNLSTDEFTEKMVGHVFTLLKDLAE